MMRERRYTRTEPLADTAPVRLSYRDGPRADQDVDWDLDADGEDLGLSDVQDPVGQDAKAVPSTPGTERKTGENPLTEESQRERRRNPYHTQWLHRMFRLAIRPGSKVLHVGCSGGDLLNTVEPSYGLGIDTDAGAISTARQRFPHLDFCVENPRTLHRIEVFDYIIISKPLGEWQDVQHVFEHLRPLVNTDSRVVIACSNRLWEGIRRLGTQLRILRPRHNRIWLAPKDIAHLLHLAGFEVISTASSLMMPRRIPFLAPLCNHFLSLLPGFRRLNLVTFLSARPSPVLRCSDQVSVSVIVPCKNECGSIAETVRRIPPMGRDTEIIFVDGNSTDGTPAEVRRQIQQWPNRRIRLIHQEDGIGKGDAVRRGFAAATGDVLVVLDADLTAPPEDLPKFFRVWCEGKGELVNGSRLVYPRDKGAMRFLNLLGNKFFCFLLTWLFGQRLGDTLCGTKMISKEHYRWICENRVFPEELDPFGDFDLLLGAMRQQLKVVDVPVRYKARAYGKTRINRFRDGWLLLRVSWVAFKRIKWLDIE